MILGPSPSSWRSVVDTERLTGASPFGTILKTAGLFSALYMTRSESIASTPPTAMR